MNSAYLSQTYTFYVVLSSNYVAFSLFLIFITPYLY